MDTLLEELKKHTEHFEGRVNAIYVDTTGHKTAGIGHYLREGEEKLDWSDDTVIDNMHEKDCRIAISEAKKFCDLDVHPFNVQLAICDLIYNMGRPTLSKFIKFKAALDNKNYNTAADELFDSRWRKQVARRAPAVIELIRQG